MVGTKLPSKRKASRNESDAESLKFKKARKTDDRRGEKSAVDRQNGPGKHKSRESARERDSAKSLKSSKSDQSSEESPKAAGEVSTTTRKSSTKKFSKTRKVSKEAKESSPREAEPQQREEAELPSYQDENFNESLGSSDTSEDDDVDEATAKLVASLDQEENEADGGSDSEDGGVEIDISELPHPMEKMKRKATTGKNKPGVVFISRIPHGFYEREMNAYFSQFGEITRLRLSRNKKTGQSKHYAFVEFASTDVAEIVAKTMNNYLLFNHILKVSVIPPDAVHPELFKGAGKRYRVIPRNRMEKRKLMEPKSIESWDRQAKKEEKRRLAKLEQMKEMGYEYDMVSVLLATAGDKPSERKQEEALAS